MKKSYIIFSSSIFVIVVISIILVVLVVGKKKNSNTNQTQTATKTNTIPTAIPTEPPIIPAIVTTVPSQKIQITHIQPADVSTNVPTAVTIKATFNQDITSQNITFSILPPTPFTLQKNENMAIVTFDQPLKKNSQYIYSFNHNNIELLPAFSLTTEGQGEVITPDTSINPAGKALEEQQKNDPETYLQNYSPYETDAFSFNFDFSGSHLYFTVTSKEANKDDAKQQFFAWIQSIGLTQQQLQTLDIRYQ